MRLAEVTDGLSNTLLFGETDYTTWYGAWTVGDGYDTLVGTMAPPNVNTPVLPGWQPMSMMSLHPGGVNCTFGDGSVKFIKNSIDSWPYDPNLQWSPSLGWTPVFYHPLWPLQDPDAGPLHPPRRPGRRLAGAVDPRRRRGDQRRRLLTSGNNLDCNAIREMQLLDTLWVESSQTGRRTWNRN